MSTSLGVLTPEEVCELLNGAISTKTLANWRSRPDKPGPPYYRYGNKIRYRRTDLDVWIESRRHTSTETYRGQVARLEARKLEAQRAALEEKRQALLQELAALDSQLGAPPQTLANAGPEVAPIKRGPGRPRKSAPEAIEAQPPRPAESRVVAPPVPKRPRGRPRKPR